MCKHNLRTMLKVKLIPFIAGWEMIYWIVICGWIIAWHWKLDSKEIYNRHVDENGVSNARQQKKVNEKHAAELMDWDKGLYAHGVLALLFVPLAGVLMGGVRRRSRIMILSWMIFSTIVALLRIMVFAVFYRAWTWLKWLEFYWICRVYFLIVCGHYCLDLWSQSKSAETVEHPLLLPMTDDRAWRGHRNYPEVPMTLNQRPRIYGVGTHIPQHLDWRYVVHPYPEYFESRDVDGRTVLVLDTPAYNPDSR